MSSQEELLQVCLDDLERGASLGECLERHDALPLAAQLAVAERLRRGPAVSPAPAFRATARARLLSRLDDSPRRTAPSALVWLAAFQSWRPDAALLRLSAALVALLVVAGVVLVPASTEAAADSPLFPAKLALEQLRFGLANSAEAREQLRLAAAEARGEELALLAERGAVSSLEAGERRYAAALAALPLAGGEEQERSLARQQWRLQAALSQAGPEARASLGRALGALARHRADPPSEQLGPGPRQPSTPPSFGPGPAGNSGNGAGPAGGQRPTATPSPTAVQVTPTPTGQGRQGTTTPPRYGQPSPTVAIPALGPLATPAGYFGTPPATPDGYLGTPPATPASYQGTPPATPGGSAATPPAGERDGSGDSGGASGGDNSGSGGGGSGSGGGR